MVNGSKAIRGNSGIGDLAITFFGKKDREGIGRSESLGRECHHTRAIGSSAEIRSSGFGLTTFKGAVNGIANALLQFMSPELFVLICALFVCHFPVLMFSDLATLKN